MRGARIKLRRLHAAMLRSTVMPVADFRRLTLDELLPNPWSTERSLFAIAHRVRVDETSLLVPHANNVVILSWIDLVAEQHGDAAGASRSELFAAGKMWFVARHEIDYLGESFAGDEVIIATWIETLGRTSLRRATRIASARDGHELVRATSRWALVDLTTRRPTAIPDAVRAALAGE